MPNTMFDTIEESPYIFADDDIFQRIIDSREIDANCSSLDAHVHCAESEKTDVSLRLSDILSNIVGVGRGDQEIIKIKNKPTGRGTKCKIDIKDVLKLARVCNRTEASKRIGMGQTWLKKILRRYGMPFWPHRKFCSIQMIRNKVIKYISEVEAGTLNPYSDTEHQQRWLTKKKVAAERALKHIYQFENYITTWIYGNVEMEKQNCICLVEMMVGIMDTHRSLLS